MADGLVTVVPLIVQLLVKPVVVNRAVRSAVLPWQILIVLSAPNTGFGLTVSVTVAVSLQPELLVTIS